MLSALATLRCVARSQKRLDSHRCEIGARRWPNIFEKLVKANYHLEKPMTTTTALFLVLTTFIVSLAQGPPADRQQFIRTEAPIVILRHVRVVDGTGAPPTEDQSIIISDGKIKSIVPGNNLVLPANAAVLDLPGYTVLPGLVGMHDHMFFPMGGTPPMYSNMG